jgi:cytoskeletal protein CcmA (bactofilin family)
MFGRSSIPESNLPKPVNGPANGPTNMPISGMNILSNTAAPAPLSAQPAAPGTSGRASPFAAASTMTTSTIGTDLTILGEKITIISQNRLQIDGDVRGDISGRQVIIGEEGSVIGTISAESIEVRGGVRGAIKAHNVILTPTAQVEGDIHHITLTISEGAEFDGRVKRAKDANELRPNLDVNSYPSTPPKVARELS